MKTLNPLGIQLVLMTQIEFPKESVDFIGFGEDTSVTKVEVEGRKLWDLLFQRDNNFGGFLAGLFGIMGSGKTSLMIQMARRIMHENPDEIIFWREPLGNPLQARNIGDNFQILCERRYPVKPWVMHPHSNKPTDDIKVRKFIGFKGLLRMVKPQMLNVVYFNQNWRWIGLVDKLKRWGSWQTLFLDEVEDVIPGRCKGKAWEMNERFANSIKEIR